MNYDKSYLEQYDNDYDITVKKKNISNQKNIYNDNSNVIILQNKVEELLLKLKFLNSNKKNISINILEYINNNLFDQNCLININNLNINSNFYPNNNSNNIISLINEIILKLDTKIISKGQIRRKNNSIEFEF